MKRKKSKRYRRSREQDVVTARPLEVTLEQARGDTSRMIRKFMKKVRKEEVLVPFYGKLAYPTTKGQKRRAKKSRKKWLEAKRLSKLDDER